MERVGWGEYIWAVACCFERLKAKDEKRMIVFPSSLPSPAGEGVYVVCCEFCFFGKYKNINITVDS